MKNKFACDYDDFCRGGQAYGGELSKFLKEHGDEYLREQLLENLDDNWLDSAQKQIIEYSNNRLLKIWTEV
jgi:hypothetical protein